MAQQPTWTDAMDVLLIVAGGTVVLGHDEPHPEVTLETLVKRSFIAPGPDFARDCPLLAVYWDRIDADPVGMVDVLGGFCHVVPSITLVLVYAQDCVPTQDDDGVAPDAADIEAYALRYANECTALWQTVTQAALDGALSAGGCCEATVGQASPGRPSPQGGMVQTLIPVTLRLQA